ncbi:hypothetical protein [Thermus sp.]|uniref:hypothetical protein n=1 Tax=Thermus sp. TaxID=275 RepID=UPI003D0ECA53
MRVVRGDFLQGGPMAKRLVVAPTNGVITARGLVMGAGAARALAQAEPRLPALFAEAIRRVGTQRAGWWEYGFVAAGPYGAFQTKGDWRNPADLGLIRLAASRLRDFLEVHPGLEVHMAFPGIGLGGLKPEAVLRVLEEGLGPQGERVVLYRLR